MWLGLGVAYFSVYPVGFFVTTFGFAVYVLAQRGRRGGRSTRADAPGGDRRGRRAALRRDAASPAEPVRRASPTCSSQPFLRYAFLAGTAIALASGLVGYFVVLRSQVFTGDALSHVAFTGALAALAAGADLLLGLYGACVIVALAMAALGPRAGPTTPSIGSVFAWMLGLGALFLTIYTTSSSGTGRAPRVSTCCSAPSSGCPAPQADHRRASSPLGVVRALMIVIARPLLFASIDDAVAAAAGCRSGCSASSFLGLVGVTAAAATQAVGALLLLGLLAAPAGAAQRLTAGPSARCGCRPGSRSPRCGPGSDRLRGAAVPPSFGILAVATGCYLVVALATTGRAALARATRRLDETDAGRT